jgi:hypothetical protein
VSVIYNRHNRMFRASIRGVVIYDRDRLLAMHRVIQQFSTQLKH